MVPLLHIYSNTPELLSTLESIAWTVRRADLQDEPVLPSTERAWRLHDRLSEAEMDAVVASYYNGTSVAELARRYGINHWSVKKLVRERGQRFRQGGSGVAFVWVLKGEVTASYPPTREGTLPAAPGGSGAKRSRARISG